MRIASIFFFTVLFSDLVYGSFLNENIFKSSEMKEIDFKVAVTSSVLLDKDLNFIARLIRRAYDLGFNTGYLKGIVLDHFILVENDEKYQKFIDLLREQRIYRNHDTKESLTCAGLVKINNVDITKFILKKPNKFMVQWVELVKRLIKKDGQPIFTESLLNILLIESQIFNFKLHTFTALFWKVINELDEFSITELKLFIRVYEKLINKIGETNSISKRLEHVIDLRFLEKINEQNKEAAKEVIEFVSRVNPQSGFVGCTSYIHKSIKDQELFKLVYEMNSRKVNEFYRQYESVFSKYEKDQAQIESVFEFLNNPLESQEFQVAHTHCCIWLFIWFIHKAGAADKMENEEKMISTFKEKVLGFFIKSDVDYNSFLSSAIINELTRLKAWNLVSITLDHIDQKGIPRDSESLNHVLDVNFIQFPDEIFEKFFKTILYKLKLECYQFIYISVDRFHTKWSKLEIMEKMASEFRFDRFNEFAARAAVAQLGQLSPQTANFVEDQNPENNSSNKKILMSLDQKLRAEYSPRIIDGKPHSFFPESKADINFLEYIAVINVEEVKKLNPYLTEKYVEKLIKMIDFDELCECLSGIAARLAIAELYNHLRVLFDVVCSLQTESSDQRHIILISMLKRVSRAAIDLNSLQSLTIITNVCATLLAVQTNSGCAHEQVSRSLETLHNTHSQFKNDISSISMKASKYITLYSLQCSSEELVMIMNLDRHLAGQ